MSGDAPFSHPSLMRALADVEREVAGFFDSLSPDEFVLRVGDAWTPAEHLAHLNSAVSAVARGFAMPRWLLRLRFGRARRPSRTFDELRDDYLARLAAGGRASGAFVPALGEQPVSQAVELRHTLLLRWARVNGRLRAALETWPDRQLDRIPLPHPLLGSITAREMVFFTVHHGRHHIRAATRRLPRLAGPAETG